MSIPSETSLRGRRSFDWKYKDWGKPARRENPRGGKGARRYFGLSSIFIFPVKWPSATQAIPKPVPSKGCFPLTRFSYVRVRTEKLTFLVVDFIQRAKIVSCNCICVLISQRYFAHPIREDLRVNHACGFLSENPTSLVTYRVQKRHFFR